MKLCRPNRGSFCFSVRFFFSAAGFLGHSRLPLGGIIHLCETRDWQCGVENRSRRQFPEIKVGSKRVEFQFCLNYCVAKQREWTGCKGSQQQPLLLFHWLNIILTSAASPRSSFSLILFTCWRRRSQYNLSSDILVFSASVFSWSSVIATTKKPEICELF